MKFGELASNYNWSIAQYIQHRRQRRADPMRRLKKHSRYVAATQVRQDPFLKGFRPTRGETEEREPVCLHARRRQGGHDGARARHGHDREAGLPCGADQEASGVGDERRAGVGHERDVVSGPQPIDQSPGLLCLVVFVQARAWRRDRVMREEPGRTAGIFGRNQLHLTQHPQRTQGDVFEVADRRGHHVKGARQGLYCTIAK